ncbi:hypothetical protein M422DRAFT_265356 [Sphaerobolus stellatus SS14]|uniref:EF-hand domain-containing protein n=1 Tax=Sphaerobolus stellatus (strain SS14) TaxID=990650 RepID=A0A0C9UU04_SPHS4|nr:hypothetical protein M422DRAFT_265356 [Sphaerobolus stellatus SS14]
MSEFLQFAIEMWALPGLHPPQFLPKHVKQYLSGALHYLPFAEREATLQKIMQMTSPGGGSLWSIENLQSAMAIIHKIQGLKDTFKMEKLSYLHLIGNNPVPIIFYHAGIHRVPPHITKQCVMLTLEFMGDKEKIDKLTAMQIIFSRVEASEYTTHILNSFESAWLIVDVDRSGNLDLNGLYILMYLLSIIRLDVALPHRLPAQVIEMLLGWRDEDDVNL